LYEIVVGRPSDIATRAPVRYNPGMTHFHQEKSPVVGAPMNGRTARTMPMS
jgi:hypothetical protein